MLKRIGLSVMLLGGLLAFAAPRQAYAPVRFGVYVGVRVPGFAGWDCRGVFSGLFTDTSGPSPIGFVA